MEYTHTHIQRRPSNFLVLSPVASTSYPQGPPVREPQPAAEPIAEAPVSEKISQATTEAETQSTTSEEAVVPGTTEMPDAPETSKTRRSSSVGSEGSSQFRFLKLGPVHFGGEPGVPDYCEVEE